jgi:hypothetical protein
MKQGGHYDRAANYFDDALQMDLSCLIMIPHLNSLEDVTCS